KAEWIELQNIGTEAVDISKWKINDGSNHVFNAPPKNGSTGSLIMPAGSDLVLSSDANAFMVSHLEVAVSVISLDFNLSNDKGKISLLNASSTAVDKVSYAASKGGDGTGESLQLVDGTFIAAKPTPGSENSTIRIPKTVVAVVSSAKASKSKKTVA